MLIVRKEDGNVKLLVYCKPSHTDQYLSFNSHHPLYQKLGVICRLLDRCQNIVTDDKDNEIEETHITEALQRCGCPRWSFNKVKKQMGRNQEQKIKNRKEKKDKSRGMVVIPYVKAISEALERIYRKHNISTAMRPHMSLRKLLVHPKDKRNPADILGVVYSIPCRDCNKVYVGETGQQFGVRRMEHQKEADELSNQHFTRKHCKRSESILHKSAISDYIRQNNHNIDWNNAKILAKEDQRTSRHIGEDLHSRKRGDNTMNRDESQHFLPVVYNPIIHDGYPSSSESKKNEK